MQLRLRLGAHWRGCEREARLHPGRVRGRATHPRQVGLSPLRTADPGARAAARHRQRYPDGRATRPGAHREISRSLTAVPTGGHLWTRRPRTAALDTRAVGRCLWSAPYAAGGRDEGAAPHPSGPARGRDAGADAQAWTWPHAPGVPLEL